MQKYRWPGYEMQLLRELQRQQNTAQLCDTLLQTEGISVPTHSCVLAALSPYLSHKLSACPPPPSGQKHRLQLQAVKAQTLLKLVGLLYSGGLEVKGGVERDDVLSAASQFGITCLLEGREPQRKSFGSCREEEEGGRERNESRKMQDAQVQVEMAGRRDTVEKRSFVSAGTQTVQAGGKTAGLSFTRSHRNNPLTREPASSAAQSLDFSISLQPQNITLEKHYVSIPISGAPNVRESTSHRPSDRETNPSSTSALSSGDVTFPLSLYDNQNSLTLRGDGASQQPSEFVDSVEVLAKGGTGLEDGEMADNRENAEQPREETLGEERGRRAEKSHPSIGRKSVAKMKQMMKTTQISIKVKLRRRTKGDGWEVVSFHDADETLSVHTSVKQVGIDHKRPHTDRTDGEPPPSSTQPDPVHKPETLILQPPTTNSPEPPPHPNTTSDSQPLSGDRFTPNHQNDGLESAPLPQPPGLVEESDEQIEKLLEDIMMGLNILPNMEGDRKRTHHLQPSHDGAPTVCQVPDTESDRAQMNAAVSAAECVYYQDFGTQRSPSTDTVLHSVSASRCIRPAVSPEGDFSPQSKWPHCYVSSCQSLTIQNPLPNTNHLSFVNSRWIDGSLPTCCSGIHCVFTAQNQPSCSSLASVHPDDVLFQPQQQSRNYPYPEGPMTRLVIPTAIDSSEQKLHYPTCQEPSPQERLNVLQFLPMTNGNDAEPSHSFSLPCMDDLRLPHCLSPLEPSAPTHHPLLSNSANQADKIQPQPSLHGRPWLTQNPTSLQFPLGAVAHRDDKRTSLPKDSKRSCGLKPRKKRLQLNPQNRGTRAEPYPVKKVEERGTISADQNTGEPKYDPRKVKESLKCQQSDTNDEAAEPKKRKRKRTSRPQDAVGSLLACKDVKVSVGTKTRINLCVCSVSLSSNNVLAKEREMASSSSNMANKFVGKPTTIAESRAASGPADLDQTRIRTRGFLKKTGDTPSNSSLRQSSVLKPEARRPQTVCQQEGETPKRKRGRPSKRKLEESHDVESEQQVDDNLPKKQEEEEGEKTKKQRGNVSEGEMNPLEKTIRTEGHGKVEAEVNNEVNPAGRTHQRPAMVSLKEFQKLIERQHSKTRKSRKSQDGETNKTIRDVDSEGRECGSRSEESTKETGMDSAQPQNRTEESRVVFSVTVDKNHNQIFHQSRAEYVKSQRGDANSSTSKKTGDEHRPVFSFYVLGKEMAKLAAEREQPRETEAQKAGDSGVSDTVSRIVDSSRLFGDTRLPQDDKTPSDHNLNPRTPERTAPPLMDAVGISKSFDCNQVKQEEEEEDEEEEEVDVLLYSPDKASQTRECENGLDNMDITPEEEEEEEEDDVQEIDVTGDEAE